MRSLTAILAISALLLVACGGGGSSSSSSSSSSQSTTQDTAGAGQASAEGKQVFTQNCAGCHALKDAGANGSVGPDLDDLKPDASTVEHQVINGGGQMPAFKGRLSDAQIKDVAGYVSSVAGKG